MRRGCAPWVEPAGARTRLLTTLINALQEPRFDAAVMAFIAEHLDTFAVNSDEHHHEWKEIHNAYKALFEAHVGEVLAREDLTGADFIEVVQKVQSTNSPEAHDALDGCLHALSASE